MKTCRTCKSVKQTSEFHRDRARPDGLVGECKSCRTARVRVYQSANSANVIDSRRKFVRSDKGKAASRKAYLRKKYNIEVGERDELLAEQGGRCAACRSAEPGRYWCVDHNHATGQVRGILCWHCNVGLGHFRDDVAALRRAADYLIEAAGDQQASA